ncbi:MAG: hypothetical protein AVDCRST_MAG64-4140, partial [uncultured Phycisphaerae bacterium]
ASRPGVCHDRRDVAVLRRRRRGGRRRLDPVPRPERRRRRRGPVRGRPVREGLRLDGRPPGQGARFAGRLEGPGLPHLVRRGRRQAARRLPECQGRLGRLEDGLRLREVPPARGQQLLVGLAGGRRRRRLRRLVDAGEVHLVLSEPRREGTLDTGRRPVQERAGAGHVAGRRRGRGGTGQRPGGPQEQPARVRPPDRRDAVEGRAGEHRQGGHVDAGRVPAAGRVAAAGRVHDEGAGVHGRRPQVRAGRVGGAEGARRAHGRLAGGGGRPGAGRLRGRGAAPAAGGRPPGEAGGRAGGRLQGGPRRPVRADAGGEGRPGLPVGRRGARHLPGAGHRQAGVEREGRRHVLRVAGVRRRHALVHEPQGRPGRRPGGGRVRADGQDPPRRAEPRHAGRRRREDVPADGDEAGLREPAAGV